MGEHFEGCKRKQNQQETCILANCSCSLCDSLLCFDKRNPTTPCSCAKCDKSEACNFFAKKNSTKMTNTEKINAAYLLAKSVAVTDRQPEEFVDEDILYESDIKTIIDANRPPPASVYEYSERLLTKKVSSIIKHKSTSLNEYIDKITEKENKNKQNYVVKLKEAKRPPGNYNAPSEQFECTAYTSSCKYRSSESASGKMCRKNCTVNSSSDRKSVFAEDDPNYESDRKKIIEANRSQSLSAYMDKISFNSLHKRKQNVLDDYVKQLTTNNKQSKILVHASDIRSLEPFESTLYSNRNYSAPEPSRKRKRNCCGQCKKLKCTKGRNVMVSCPVMNVIPSTPPLSAQPNKISGEKLNTTASCKALLTNNNNNYFDIFKKLMDIYKTCSCKVCDCIAPKIIGNELCTCKPCNCAECTHYGTINSTSGRNFTEPKTYVPSKQDVCLCEPCECHKYENSDNIKKPRRDCTIPLSYEYNSMTTPKVPQVTVIRSPSECLPSNPIERLRKFIDAKKCLDKGYDLVEKDNHDGNKQTTLSTPSSCLFCSYKRNKNGHDSIPMYTTKPNMYPNLLLSDIESKTCNCKECECIVCKEVNANAIKSSRLFGATIDYSTNLMESTVSEICTCKPCECQECVISKYKREQMYTTYKQSNDSINTVGEKCSLFGCRCSVCRCEPRFSDLERDFVSVCPEKDARIIKKGDVLTPSAHQAKVQKLMEKSKTKSSLTNQKESSQKVLNVNIKSQWEYFNTHKSKNNSYRDNSAITQTKEDRGTLLTRSFDRWDISHCDAGVQSVQSTEDQPVLINNYTYQPLGSYTSIYSSAETISKVSLSKENRKGAHFTAISNKSSVSSSCYSSGYVVRFPKSAVTTCIEGVLKSGLDNDLNLYKFSFNPKQQTGRNVYQASDENVTEEASTSTSADNKYGENIPYFSGNTKELLSSDEITKREDNDYNVDHDNNAIRLNTDNVTTCVSRGEVYKLENNDLIQKPNTTSDSSNINNQGFRENTHDNHYHTIQNLTLAKCINNYDTEKMPLVHESEVLNIYDGYERVRKILKDSQEYNLHLQELLQKYEKENKDFVKISDNLKDTYESVYIKNGNGIVPNRDVDVNAYKHSKEMYKQNGQTETNNETPNEVIVHVVDEITDIPSKDLEQGLEKIDMAITNTEEVATLTEHLGKLEDETYTLLDEETETMPQGNFNNKCDYPKPCGVNKGENVCLESPDVAPKQSVISTSLQTNFTSTTKKLSFYKNEALKQLQKDLKKLVDLAVLQSLGRVDDNSSFVDSTSVLSSKSKFDFDLEYSDGTFNKQYNQPSKHANKEVYCNNLQLMKDLKRQIKEQLKKACKHPLLSKQPSIEFNETLSINSHTSCESKKVRYLMVQKISEHTALVKWSQPREISDVQGYELLVDGRAVQKIFNPSKCVAAVTCLPHSDQILLTIRTLTSIIKEVGHYPSSTIVYRPRVKYQ